MTACLLLVALVVPAAVHAQSTSGTVILTSATTANGPALFTGDGKALYMFTYDTPGSTGTPATSSCSGKCAAAWPPLLVSGPIGGIETSGEVQSSGVGTIERNDGAFQVTYFGHPLYLFINDKAPQQITGENVGAFNGLWHLMSPDGLPNAGQATVNLESSAAGPVLSSPTAFNTYRSLYNLTTDPANVTTCTGGCARFWPPLLTTGQPIAGAGIDSHGLGTTRRPDGTWQVTYFGVPLYFFAFDVGAGAKSGLTNGEDNIDQFNNGVWYLINTSGVSAPAQATIDNNASGVLTFGGSPLYTFSGDTAASSACAGLCARTFIPLLTSEAPQAASGSNVSTAMLGTIRRADGTAQVTYNGHPLYLFGVDFNGTDGRGLNVFDGTSGLVAASGAADMTAPPMRSVVAIPLLSSTSSGVSASFLVAFGTANAGQSEVLFGSGPGCAGLIETATRDAGAGTTNHSVWVTGNDLAGAGDNGIQPGATYSFEVVALDGAGSHMDDNQGRCYTVTIPPA